MPPLIFFALALAPTLASAAEDELPVEFQPERVTIAIRFADSPELLPGDRERIQHDIQGTIRRLVGARWSVTYTDAGFLSSSSLGRLDALDLPIDRATRTAELPEPFPLDAAPDKYFVAAVAPSESGFAVTAREWDRLTDSLTPPVSRFATSHDDIAGALAAALVAAYRPVARIEDNDGTPLLHFRGGALPTPDPDLLAPAAGTLLQAALHRRDRDGHLVEVRPVPYTYLELTELKNGIGTVTSHSALRSALGSRRGLVAAWAVAAPPVADATRLTLLRETDAVPLAGRRVEIRAEPFQPGQEQQPEPMYELLTDRTGTATIPRDPQQPLVWATIKSGTATLMRIPIAAGADREIELRLGNDQRRLDAEGRIAILTGELIGTVAKRATLIAKAKRASREDKFDEARAALESAAALPTADEFQRRLSTIETPAANAAEQAGERLAAARIRALAGKTAQLIDSYLKSEPIQAAREEVEELAKAAKKD